ncbi:hypothetical protein GQ54DRAFT_97862 [Martensiomyces pterosporus]|nr:hypothetical protein GQ54DRAFT_97862 [Martensiomyces pterosporus]
MPTSHTTASKSSAHAPGKLGLSRGQPQTQEQQHQPHSLSSMPTERNGNKMRKPSFWSIFRGGSGRKDQSPSDEKVRFMAGISAPTRCTHAHAPSPFVSRMSRAAPLPRPLPAASVVFVLFVCMHKTGNPHNPTRRHTTCLPCFLLPRACAHTLPAPRLWSSAIEAVRRGHLLPVPSRLLRTRKHAPAARLQLRPLVSAERHSASPRLWQGCLVATRAGWERRAAPRD